MPSAEAAEAVVRAWAEGAAARPPAIVLVEEGRHAAAVEHLLPRVRKLPPVAGESGALRSAMRVALDSGGTLVAGGQEASLDGEPGGGWEPTLFVNLDPASRFLRDAEIRGPFLCVVRTEDSVDPVASVPQGGGPLEIVPLSALPAA